MSKSTWEEKYAKLNNRQKEAVDSVDDGPVLVIAGPGSGKTELLSLRTANILRETDLLPSNILLLTFTESGSSNMRERLFKLIGEESYRVGIYTFHSFASDVINKYGEYFWNGAKYSAITEVEQINILENILQDLPRKNPLGVKHPELGYVYLRDILSAIRDLKKGNYTPISFTEKLKINEKNLRELHSVLDSLEAIAGKRKYGEVSLAYEEILKILSKLTNNEIANLHKMTLAESLEKASVEQSSKSLTAWKDKYVRKIENGKYIFKDEDPERQAKLKSLLEVYTSYQAELEKWGYYDFEDMILLVIDALKAYPNLLADLQERYQYILVDEFQDTNDSQLELVYLLADNPVNGEKANIFAVGDDYQAIFKFQGATVNNMQKFLDHFKKTKLIVLDKNYRSTQNILDYASTVIDKLSSKLKIGEEVVAKNLISANPKYTENFKSEIKIEKFESNLLEHEYIAKEIQKLIQKGIDASEIAIICRKHGELRELSNVLSRFKIPYSYTKRENVLEKEHIMQLVTILKYLHFQGNAQGDELLPEILSYDFWGIERVNIWKIAQKVRKENIPWLEAMIEGENIKIKQIGNFLISLSMKALSTPIEYLIDEIIGTTEFLWEDSEQDDSFERRVSTAKDFISPYKNYYFGAEKFNQKRSEYLDLLLSLRTFISALKEFHSKEVLKAGDIIEFVNTYSGNNLTLSTVVPFASASKSVQLLTAHAAKGLEYEYVFLLSANNEVWGRGRNGSKISFPINMQLSPEADNDDDKLRLLYVALTRAKHSLYITHSSDKLEYLEQAGGEEVKEREVSENIDILLSPIPVKDFVLEEKQLLKSILENYKMPVTHLNNFLNFTRIGPEKFVENNLLRFPQAITPSAAYGSAMHDTIEKYFLYWNKNNKLQSIKEVKNNFQNTLARFRQPENEFKKYLESGLEKLDTYIEDLKKRKILLNTKVEIKFKSEDVVVGECPITGNIDRMEFVGGQEIIVTDLKTGESYDSFEEKGLQDYEKIKLHFYKYQLAFYALLIENSRTFQDYKVEVGNLEFIEANKQGKIDILSFEIDQEIKKRVKRLANAVCQKIHNLDFPDTTRYSQNYKGVLQFEEDLLNGNI